MRGIPESGTNILMKQNVILGKGQTSPSGKITAENSGLTGKVVFFDQNDYEGLNSEYDYLFGGRSFTVYCVDGSGMKEVYTSGNELEAKTAAYFPQYFNCSNDSAEIDDRSGKNGRRSRKRNNRNGRRENLCVYRS